MRIAAATLLLLGALAPAAHGRVEIPGWVRGAIPAELPAPGDASAQVLLTETLVQVEATGAITTHHKRVVKILTAAGREEGYIAVYFDKDAKIRSLNGWSIDPDGHEYALRERDAVETSAGDFELYTDTRMKVLRVPADIGSIVAFEYEREERPYLMQSAWHFQENVPVLKARYQVALPPNWTVDARWLNHPVVEPASPGRWELQNVAAVLDEPRRPSTRTLAGRVGLNFLAPGAKPLAWADVARWYAKLAVPRATPTAPMQAKVRELVAGDDQPMLPLSRFAQRDVRYVAIEIGIGGYEPHAAGEVFANRFGDCKDKATLLKTMLKEVGIDARFVLVHATRGATDPSFPSMDAFNHVIAAIPVSAEAARGLKAVVDHPRLGKLLLFDPTSTLTPFGHLPESLQASRGLLVTADGGELIDLPSLPADANQLQRVARLMLDGNGTLSGTVEEVRTGTMAVAMRATLQPLNAAERVRSIESRLASALAASTTDQVSIEFLDEPESDLVIRYRINVPNYARRVADMLLVRPRVMGSKGETLTEAKRTYAYVTEGPSLHSDDVEIRLPASVQLDELPAKVEIRNPMMQYASNSTFEGGVLRYRRQYAMHSFAIPRESLPELNNAWKQILGDERASAVFR